MIQRMGYGLMPHFTLLNKNIQPKKEYKCFCQNSSIQIKQAHSKEWNNCIVYLLCNDICHHQGEYYLSQPLQCYRVPMIIF
jgi:hypothetical protein